jgi:hypothetical protein
MARRFRWDGIKRERKEQQNRNPIVQSSYTTDFRSSRIGSAHLVSIFFCRDIALLII